MELYKTTLVILSEYDPSSELNTMTDLVRDADTGDAYCYSCATEQIDCEDLDGEGVKEFFNCLGEDDAQEDD